MPDQDGYPTEEELERVKNWDALDRWGLVSYLRSIWWVPDRHVIVYRGKEHLRNKHIWKLALHTGGWSGNEDIIGVLKGTMFWFLGWRMSRAGGHYWFDLPPKRSKVNPPLVGEPVARG